MASAIELLAQEVESQLTRSPESSTPLPFIASNDFNKDGDGDDFRVLHDILKSHSVDQLSTTPFPDTSLLWKLPAYCGHRTHVFDEKAIKERLKRFSTAKFPGGQALTYSEAMWKSDEVRTWINSKSSILTVEGSAALADFLTDFALKVVESREDAANGTRAVAYMLSPNPIRDFPAQYKCPGATEVLRQISIQILRHASSAFPLKPWELLAEAVVAMQNAKNSRDWFQFIGRLSCLFRHVDVVIDVQTLGAKWREAKSWPQDIKEVLAHFETTARLSVMLITAFPLSVPDVQGEILRLGTFTSQGRATRQHLPVVHSPKVRSITEHSPSVPLDTRDLPRTAGTQAPYFREPLELGACDTGLATSTQLSADENVLRAEPLGQLPDSINEPKEVSSNRLESVSGNGSNPMVQSMRRSEGSDQAQPGTPAAAVDYKVAIFCALPEEADAVEATFTSHFKPTFPKAPSDTNAYSLGLIATHYVVLVHIGGMGKSNAARAAANCRATFHNLKVALVVGICGGVPNIAPNEQIYLGDVIVSSGMELYDFGRQFPHGFVRKTDESSIPTRHSVEIKALLAKFATSYCRQRCQELTITYLRDLENLDRYRGVYPGCDEDKVFRPMYRHKHHDGSCATCAGIGGAVGGACDASLKMSCEELGCDEAHLLRKGQADRRANANVTQTPCPEVKFGKIASGDKVMKSGEERDALAREMDIIAFEMEGAGVWDTFQGNCLVIKAACDYADSHKSKKWQKYAALTAASFTKAFLEEWS